MAMNNDFDREIRFEIVEEIGVITVHSTGWRKELNLVCWNGGLPKYDIRDWSPDHERMSRGVTLHENEMRHIFDLMKKRRTKRTSRRKDPGNSPLPADDVSFWDADESIISNGTDEPSEASAICGRCGRCASNQAAESNASSEAGGASEALGTHESDEWPSESNQRNGAQKESRTGEALESAGILSDCDPPLASLDCEFDSMEIDGYGQNPGM